MGLAELHFYYLNHEYNSNNYMLNGTFFNMPLALNSSLFPYNSNPFNTNNSFWNLRLPSWESLELPRLSFIDNNHTVIGNVHTNGCFDTFHRTTSFSPQKVTDNKFSNYDASKGNCLAQTALNNTNGNFTGYCARYVKNAIQEAGLGNYTWGHAYQLASDLRKNPNFKEISTDNLDLKNLPAGCVLVYDRGVAGYSSKYGHTEITIGDGRAVSDGITKNLHKKPSSIFMPFCVA